MSDILNHYTRLCKVIEPTLVSVAEIEMLLRKQPYQSIKKVNSKDVVVEVSCGTNSYAVTVYNVLNSYCIYDLRVVKTCVQIMQQKCIDAELIKKRARLFLAVMKEDFNVRSRNTKGSSIGKGEKFKNLSDDQKSALKRDGEAHRKLVDQVTAVFKTYQLKYGI